MIRILRPQTSERASKRPVPLTLRATVHTHTHTHTSPHTCPSTTVSSAQAAEDYVLSRDSARKLLAVFGGITASELNERYEEFALFGNGQKTLDRAGFGRMVKHCASLSKVGNKSAERLVESKQFIDRCACGCACGCAGCAGCADVRVCMCACVCGRERGRERG